MRERVEDLGRLAVLLDNLLEHKLFDESNLPRRCKDCHEWWEAMSEDKRDDALHSIIYGIDDVKDKICEAISIARGQDYLNDPHA